MNEIANSLQHTLKVEAASIAAMAERLDIAAAEKIVALFLERKGKVFVTGCGTSAAAAKKIAHTLSCVERPACFLSPADAVHGGLGVVQKEDVVVIISKGGKTPELTSLVAPCKEKGAATVALTENPDSDLGRQCDYTLRIWVDKEPDPFNMLATASTLAVIAVMDAIAVCVMQANGFTKEKFALIHPGGAVGDRLLNKKA
jgi:Predicted sugar phosphate isomerase involved in capsule formation